MDNFEKPDGFKELIVTLLEDVGYCEGENFQLKEKYVVLHNLFIEDNKSFSAQFFYKDGGYISLNGGIEITRNGELIYDTSLTLTEVMRRLNKIDLYIKYMLRYNFYSITDLALYKEKLSDFIFFKKYDKKLDTLRKKFHKLYILDVDIINYDFYNQKTIEVKRSEKINNLEHKEKKRMVIYHTMKGSEISKVNMYMEKRKLKYSTILQPCAVTIGNSPYTTPAVCINYQNGFKKIRLINSEIRYVSDSYDGDYTQLLEIKKTNSNEICYITEGEIDGICLSQYSDIDVYSMHNTNSVPNTIQLARYKKILVLIDSDKFSDNRDVLKSKFKKVTDAEVLIIEKVKQAEADLLNLKKIDLNDLYVDNKLKERELTYRKLF